MEEDISPTSLNVTEESSSRFKLVVNAYKCFIESDEHNEGLGVGGGGGTPHIKGVGMLVGNFELNH